ncbi:hypothetical protein HPB48_005130 [Haemaphysalis longicornis]|uniref:Uncharacterized protein n=1 Tax=Haemaphysalis longicornis TaxID=44386 RepID=A0A9J6FFG6_HAELO|nr:hypothetical protein HPB48_005130 [Haemaphysalis longicornis]
MLIAQKRRLQLTRKGRAILERVGTPTDKINTASKIDLDEDICRKLFISPIPKLMDNTARIACVEKKLHGDPNQSTPTQQSTKTTEMRWRLS